MKCTVCKGQGMIGAGTKMNDLLPDFMSPIVTRVCHVCDGSGEESEIDIDGLYDALRDKQFLTEADMDRIFTRKSRINLFGSSS